MNLSRSLAGISERSIVRLGGDRRASGHRTAGSRRVSASSSSAARSPGGCEFRFPVMGGAVLLGKPTRELFQQSLFSQFVPLLSET